MRLIMKSDEEFDFLSRTFNDGGFHAYPFYRIL